MLGEPMLYLPVEVSTTEGRHIRGKLAAILPAVQAPVPHNSTFRCREGLSKNVPHSGNVMLGP